MSFDDFLNTLLDQSEGLLEEFQSGMTGFVSAMANESIRQLSQFEGQLLEGGDELLTQLGSGLSHVFGDSSAEGGSAASGSPPPPLQAGGQLSLSPALSQAITDLTREPEWLCVDPGKRRDLTPAKERAWLRLSQQQHHDAADVTKEDPMGGLDLAGLLAASPALRDLHDRLVPVIVASPDFERRLRFYLWLASQRVEDGTSTNDHEGDKRDAVASPAAWEGHSRSHSYEIIDLEAEGIPDALST